MSYGAIPYPGWNNATVIEKVNEGHRLPKPEICPDDVYHIMLACWVENPNDRPSFSELHNQMLSFVEKYKDTNEEESMYN